MPGAVLHGMIGMKIEVIRAAAEMTLEYSNLFFSCIFSYRFLSL